MIYSFSVQTTEVMKKQTIAIVLLVTILLQSCVAYQNTSMSIDEAQNKGPVRVTSTQGDNIKFRNIQAKDGAYYGVNGNRITQIDPAQIISIHLKDFKKSKTQTAILATFLTVSVLALVIVAVVAASVAVAQVFPLLLVGI